MSDAQREYRLFMRDFGYAAYHEGWCLSESFLSEFGPWQIQRVNDLARLSTDQDAWKIVLEGQLPHHVAARTFIDRWNQRHMEEMLKFGQPDSAKLDAYWTMRAVRAVLTYDERKT